MNGRRISLDLSFKACTHTGTLKQVLTNGVAVDVGTSLHFSGLATTRTYQRKSRPAQTGFTLQSPCPSRIQTDAALSKKPNASRSD
jgi:hypothetical protein